METSECIRQRRSIRSYTKKDVTYEQITKLIDAATHAPNAGNLQTWKFTIVRDKKTKEKITEICEQEWMKEAPVFIIVNGQKEIMEDQYGERGYIYNIQSCSAAIQNVLLEAHNNGLGTCWVGHFDEKKINELMNVQDAQTQAIITLGYPNETNTTKRRPLYTATFFEKYGEKKRETDIFPLKDALQRRKKH